MSPRLFSLICAALSVAFFWPSEGAISGDGLPWVFAWAVVATLVAVSRISSRQLPKLSGWLPVMLFVAGFWLSTWHVFQVEGDRRAALNIAFEWTAIGLACWCVRRLPKQYLNQLPTLIVALGIGISVLGILQYHVANEKLADWYRSQIGILDSSPSPMQRQAVEAEFQSQGIPVNAAGRELFERRLLASSEPTGPFALANTLGGVLAVVLVFLIGGLQNGSSQQPRMSFVSWLLACLFVAVVGYCLVLTKSRTAWVGCVVGMAFLFGRRLDSSLAWLKPAGLICSVLLLAGFVGFASGAIDREVLLESPKSLQYRLFYWTGAAGVIEESPFFGAGPGNFRQAYLAYKVPESSEEILDPHNVFVDAWCSCGLVGLVGMVWMTLTVVLSIGRRSLDTTDKPASFRPSLLAKGIVIATMCHVGLAWINGSPLLDFQQGFFRSSSLLLVVPVTALGAMYSISGRFLPSVSSSSAAFVCLVVHLLGAGGLQISVVGLLMVVCYSLSTNSESDQTISQASIPRPVLATMFVLIAAAVVWYGIQPNTVSQHYLELAKFRKTSATTKAAVDAFESAISSDPLSVISRQQKAEFLTYELLRNQERYAPGLGDTGLDAFENDFLECAGAVDELIQSDRRRIQGYYLRSQLYRIRESLLPDTAIGRSAEDLRHVVKLYPTNVQAWAELAFLNHQNGDSEASLARDTALRLEAVNQSWGHIDRYLPDDVVDRLRALSVP